MDKIKQLFQSRKFWVLLAAVVAIGAALAAGQVDSWQALQLLIAALAAYSTGIALVDAGVAAGEGARHASPLRGGEGDANGIKGGGKNGG